MSYTVVYSALVKAGHQCADDADGADAALFSMCDVVEYNDLVRMRAECPGIPLIVGGAYGFNFWSAKLYCDAVWVGEVYEMAECRTLDELMSSVHCYTGGDVLPVSSVRIDWDKVPVAQISPKKCYYWGGVGCKNKCAFCYTSWTHIHQVNAQTRIDAAKRSAKEHGCHIMISSNEYDRDPSMHTFDMLLKDYVLTPVKASVVRCGVEFCREDTRRQMSKPITRDQLFHAIQKATHEGVSLKLFHITGYEPLDDWECYIDDICRMLELSGYQKLLTLGFNNLQYQNYTPLYRERHSIDPSYYISIDDTRRWYDRLRQYGKSVLVQAPSRFQHVCCRMGIELARDRAQVDFWRAMLRSPAKKMTVDDAYNRLFDTGVLDTPHLRFDFQTGAIKLWDE